MANSELEIYATSWSADRTALQGIRQQVFIDEQGVSAEEEWDEQDAQCTHFLLKTVSNEPPVACARLLDDGHIGRVAVKKEFRGLGLGQALIRYILTYAGHIGQRGIKLDAQTHALAFYQQLGFQAEGDEFLDAGIPHRHMTLQLPDPHSPVEFSSSPEAYEIHHTPTPVTQPTRRKMAEIPPGGSQEHCAQLATVREKLIDQLEQANRRCWIYSQALDHRLFEAPEVIEAFSGFARRNANSEIKILLVHTANLAQRGHALLRLSQRLPSLIKIRQAAPDAALGGQELMLFDQASWIEVHTWSPMEAALYQGCRAQQLDLQDLFLTAWNPAEEPPEVRSLKL